MKCSMVKDVEGSMSLRHTYVQPEQVPQTQSPPNLRGFKSGKPRTGYSNFCYAERGKSVNKRLPTLIGLLLTHQASLAEAEQSDPNRIFKVRCLLKNKGLRRPMKRERRKSFRPKMESQGRSLYHKAIKLKNRPLHLPHQQPATSNQHPNPHPLSKHYHNPPNPTHNPRTQLPTTLLTHLKTLLIEREELLAEYNASLWMNFTCSLRASRAITGLQQLSQPTMLHAKKDPSLGFYCGHCRPPKISHVTVDDGESYKSGHTFPSRCRVFVWLL